MNRASTADEKRTCGVVPLILVHESDNAAVTSKALAKGASVAVGGRQFALLEDVEPGCRIAIANIPVEEPVIQYGESVALSTGIQAGQAVTPDRVKRIEPQYVLPEDFIPRKPVSLESNPPSFRGFRRSDGNVGTRNWILVIPTVACCVHEAEQIVAEAKAGVFSGEKYSYTDGIVALSHVEGCAFCDASAERSSRMLANCVAHPNVGAAVLVELGCERIQGDRVMKQLDANIRSLKPIKVVRVQDAGSEAAIRAGVRHVADMLPYVDQARRSEISASELILGVKCGGSDGLSGITANPALGYASDQLVRFGGASLITEMSEFSGVELAFGRCAVSRDIAEEIMAAFRAHKELAAAAGFTFEINPSPGNKAGGLFNATVKGHGSMAKCGNVPVSGILQYADRIGKRRGLHLLVAPANDLVSTPALVAAGAQVVCFTTGRGTAIGNPFAPVIKISTNTQLFDRMRCDMDIDAGTIASGQEEIKGVGERILNEVLAVASGKKTAAERNGRREFALWPIGPTV